MEKKTLVESAERYMEEDVVEEMATPNMPVGIRAVRQDLGLDEIDTSQDESILNMSFEEYLGHYLSWEGIIGYTRTIAAIADRFKK